VDGSPPSKAANLLGALGTAVTDRLGDALGQSPSAAALLSALDQFLNAPTIELLAQVVGLSQSGAVRLVDRLERDGYVHRGPGADARSCAVHLTAAGRRVARGVRRRRLALLNDLIAPLSDDERQAFSALASRLLVGMMRAPGATRWTCRLCDLEACGRPAGLCPLEQEARRRYG
jgi:DNA-binding MarR family transcriptional regulator